MPPKVSQLLTRVLAREHDDDGPSSSDSEEDDYGLKQMAANASAGLRMEMEMVRESRERDKESGVDRSACIVDRSQFFNTQERRAGVMETVDLLKQLEINYKLISNDLEFASHQLDSRMAAAARSDSSMPDLHSLQNRIRALQASTPILARDAADVMRGRQEMEPDLNAALLENYKVMVGLYARLGVAPDPDWVAVADSVQGLVPAPRDTAAAASTQSAGEKGGEEYLGGGAADSTVHGAVQSGKAGKGASRVEEKSFKSAPTVIFEEDFLGVSTTTRGRSRLQDVRKMYDKIRADYEDKASRGRPGSKPEPITKRELDAAGLKVFGLTGDCILNTLRAMGLVKVSKRGVTMASHS